MQRPETLIEPASRLSPEADGRGGFAPLRFALVLALVIFASFPKVLTGLESFVVRDFGFFAYPLAYYQRECFWQGELPLWNPYNHCGVPFMAQWNTMPLYPPALIYLLLPLPWSLNLFCLVHLFWAGLGMYLLARRWTGSGVAAGVAGIAFAFNGLSLNLLMWPSHIATLSWMPWVVLAVEAGWREGGRKLIVGALAGAAQMLAGGPETILFTWLLLLALWVSQLLGFAAQPGLGEAAPSPSRGRMCWRFPAMVVLVAGLAAAQLLPFLDLAAHSQRGEGYADARWSMPGRGWANFLVPMAFGTVGKQGLFFQHGQYWTTSYYAGIGVLLLVVVGLWTVRNGRAWLLAAAGAVGLALASGDQTMVSRWARHVLPQLSLMTYPVKFVTLTLFAAPLLAAFGLRWLEGAESAQRRVRRLALSAVLLLALIGGVLFWAWRFPMSGDDVPATLHNGLARAGILAGTLLLVWALVRFRPGFGTPMQARVGGLVTVFLLLWLWLDVWTHEPNQNPTVPGWIYTPSLARTNLNMRPQPALGATRAMVAPAAEARFRGLVLNDSKDNYLVKRLGFFADCNLLDEVPTASGFFSLSPSQCGELNSLLYVSRTPFSDRLPDFLSVSHITAPDDYTKWEPRSSFLPIATAGQRPLFLDDTNAVRTLIGSVFDGRNMVILPPEARAWVTVTNQTTARVTIKRFAAAQVELEAEADQASMVVLSQTYYHRWRVYIDDRPSRLLRANYAFQAVEVPAGRHQVRFAYEDGAFGLGAGVSGAAAILCAGVWVGNRRKRSGR